MVVAPSRPLPITLLVLRSRPAKSVTVTSLISTFFMFARKMPLAQVPLMFSRVRPSSCLWGVDAGAVDKDGDVVDLDVGEAEFFDSGDALVAGDGVLAHEAGVEDVEAEKAADVAGGLEVVAGDVFNEGAAAGAGFDVDGEGFGWERSPSDPYRNSHARNSHVLFTSKNVRKEVGSTRFVADCLLQRSSPYEESLFCCCDCFWIFCFGRITGGTGFDGTCS